MALRTLLFCLLLCPLARAQAPETPDAPPAAAAAPTMHYAHGLEVISSNDAHVSLIGSEGSTTHLELTAGSLEAQAPAGAELLLDLGSWHLRAGSATLEAAVEGEKVTIHAISGVVYVRDDAGVSYPLQAGSELTAASAHAAAQVHPFVAREPELDPASAQAAQAQASGGFYFSLPSLLRSLFRF